MGLVKKWQVEKSNTLDIINNLAEVADNSITKDKISTVWNLLEKDRKTWTVLLSVSYPVAIKFDVADSSLLDNQLSPTILLGDSNVIDNDLSTAYSTSTTSSSWVEAVKIDYGTTISSARVEVKLGIYGSGSGVKTAARVEVSPDGSTWYLISSVQYTGDTESINNLSAAVELEFRYLRVRFENVLASGTSYIKVYEVIIL